ncbi:MAG: SpoIIE family protein phosphatase [Gammaproteobacteria bacterium]|nr:SpoIIE family protein phosphatase [Gammaproteobacteria bacterium]
MSKVLIVDDDAINRMILKGMLHKEGHQVIEVENGKLAVDCFMLEKPDVILMDIMMPVMSGYEAIKLIKELTEDQYVPIIALTAMTDEEELAKCLSCGADDFLTKPFSQIVLMAKIQAAIRMQGLYSTIRQQRDQIESNRQELEQEQEKASKIYKRMTKKSEIVGLSLRHHMSPMSLFNGDMLLSARSSDGVSYIFLGDATGHGLPAAVGAFPVRDIFYAMVEKGSSGDEIINELNRKLVDIFPVEFFLCGVMLVISADKKSYFIWNGGMPDVVIYRPDEKKIINKIRSANLPLGIAASDSFNAEFIEVDVKDDDSIIIYSDGVTEAQRSEGEYYGEQRFLNTIEKSLPFQVIDTVLKDIKEYCGDSSQSDDVSLIEYTVTQA